MAGPNQVSPAPTPPMAGQILRDNKANRTGSRKPLCIGLALLAVATILLGCLLPLYFLEITPFDKDGTAPSPPPPIPLAGTSASTVKFELIAEGAVTDYTVAKKATIRENVATKLGVNLADVTVTVTAASVKITVVVKTDTPDTTKAALEAKVASPTTASALLGGDVVVTSVTNAVSDVPSPPPSPPPTGSPVVVTGLKTVVGLTTVEATGGSRRQLRNLGRFAPRRLNTRPTGGEYADTSDQNEHLEDITSEYFQTPNMIMCMVANARCDAMVNTPNQPYLASIEEAKCKAKGSTSSGGGAGGSGGGKGGGGKGGGGGATSNTAKAISYMAINATRADTGCDANGIGCTAPMIVNGHVQLAQETDDPDAQHRVYFYMEVTKGADPGGTFFNGQFRMDYTLVYCPTQCDDDANFHKMGRGTLEVGQDDIPGAIGFADVSMSMPGVTETMLSYVSGPADKSSGFGAISGPDRSCDHQEGEQGEEGCTQATKVLQYGYAGTTYCVKDSSNGDENCFDRDRSQASESVWRYGLYHDATGARFEPPQGGFGIKTDDGTRGWAGYHGVHLDGTAHGSAMDGQTVTNRDGSKSYTIEVVGGRLTRKTAARKSLDAIDKVEFQFWCSAEVNVNGVLHNPGGHHSGSYTYFFAHWDAASDAFKIVGTQNDEGQKTLLSSPETVTAAQLNNFTAEYDTEWSHEPGIHGWSEGLGHSQLTISAAVLKSADAGAYPNGVRYNIETVVVPGDTTVPTTLVCLAGCPTRAKLSALGESSTESDAYTDATKGHDDIALADAVSYTFDPSQMTVKLDSEDSPLESSAIPDSVRQNPDLGHGIQVKLVPDSSKTKLLCENITKYCGWKVEAELDEFYTFEVGPQDWHSQSYLKDEGDSDSYVAFSPPLQPSFVVPDDAKYGDYAGSTQVLHYTGHGELHVPLKCFSKTTNEEEDCNHDSRHVPALSIPHDSDGFVTMPDKSIKWVKWLDREIRFKHDTDATAVGSGITLGNTSSLPEAPDPSDSNDADDPYNAASPKYAGAWPMTTMESEPAVVHGDVCSATPVPVACA